MISFRCKHCGGEMSVSRIGALKCPYCGSKNFFSDSQLKEYKSFRQRMLEYLSAAADEEVAAQNMEWLWNYVETASFRDMDGMDITIEYIYKSMEDGIWMYCARRNVIYIYPADKKNLAQTTINSFSKITYPQADMKGLQRCFPVLAGKYELEDGSIMLVYSKNENMYPAGMFGSLPAAHVEWIISRLENIACVLAFSDMVHNGITTESVFINPVTHEAALFGGWYGARRTYQGTDIDLKDLRKTAIELLGEDYDNAPKPVKRFLESTPASSAYDDFDMWDKVIENELGGRHFAKFYQT